MRVISFITELNVDTIGRHDMSKKEVVRIVKRYTRRRWTNKLAPIVWMVIGAIIAVFAIPLMPAFARSFIQDGQKTVASLLQSSGDAVGVPNAKSRGTSIIMPERPEWCPRWAEWKITKVPKYNEEAPTCVASEITTYVGRWKGLRRCIVNSAISFGEMGRYYARNVPPTEGIVYLPSGLPNAEYHTQCF